MIDRGDAQFWVERPEVPERLAYVWEAFWALTTCRSFGMAVGPIPWTAIDRYVTVHGYEGDDYEEAVYLIRQMDAAYMEFQSRKTSGDGQ